ncbi:MAG: hypothetical protein QM764_21405 [Chitinophagaceae bacterium]
MKISIQKPVKKFLRIILIGLMICPCKAISQQIVQPDSLLNQLTGKWILRGIIDGQRTTHDIDAKRVLNGQYIELTEVSREKDERGNPLYQAIVYICWQQEKEEYYCLWLDNTSNEGITNQVLGRAKANGNKIDMLFKFSDTIRFHTVFLYDRDNNTWQWMMDGEENGKLNPFARVKLTKN